jgi:hypothetical protein
MKINPTEITSDGPGIDLTNLPDDLSIKMSDPVEDFKYTRNTVTLICDLSQYNQVHLSFQAKEYGDEPHEPPSNPFTGDANFDGVAISEDGNTWYEIQGLRNLNTDSFTAFDIDLDNAIAQWGLSYNDQFKIRFCQYDNNPAPMDGIFLHAIELTGEPAAAGSAVFHLPMDDNQASPTVRDTASGAQDQVFIDPSGDPNTAAHSVPGPNGTTALSFDGVDDRIDFGPELLGDIVAAGCDFTIAFWYRTDADPGSDGKIFLCRDTSSILEAHIRFYVGLNSMYFRAGWGGGPGQYVILNTGASMLDGQWHHFALRRQGQALSLWADGAVKDNRTDPNYANSFFSPNWLAAAIGQVFQSTNSDWPFEMADLRAYDRALSDEEITSLSA